ncbi:MAG TPA: YlbF family regulator [Chondromyces sp.]|nr:YlbF family regulator [Chondromyces sp.]
MLTTTLETVLIVEKAEELAHMILQSELAERYRFFYHKLYHDSQTSRKVHRFNRLKEQYEEVQRFGRYHPDYSRIMKEVREAKRDMDLDENVAQFRVVENELQQLLDKVSALIGHSVSKGIKVPSGNPFFESGSSCGGGCGSGGSCGCSA